MQGMLSPQDLAGRPVEAPLLPSSKDNPSQDLDVTDLDGDDPVAVTTGNSASVESAEDVSNILKNDSLTLHAAAPEGHQSTGFLDHVLVGDLLNKNITSGRFSKY